MSENGKDLAFKWLYEIQNQLDNVIASGDTFDETKKDQQDLIEVKEAIKWVLKQKQSPQKSKDGKDQSITI